MENFCSKIGVNKSLLFIVTEYWFQIHWLEDTNMSKKYDLSYNKSGKQTEKTLKVNDIKNACQNLEKGK